MTKAEKLKKLNSSWEKENTCALKATATQPVFGNGSPDSTIVFIGEAPGKTEDLQGIPFVGASGRFLSEMLKSIRMNREDVYVTNVVKYRPPNNRDPLPEEKKACAQWLTDEINLIHPKIIVFLGRHAMNSFFPGLKISDAHGKVIHAELDGYVTEWFLPLYHPASALYNGSMRDTLKADFALLPKILKNIEKKSKPK